ncbi:MAG: ABC transporter permease [Solirubrobacteraceae bacterium]
MSTLVWRRVRQVPPVLLGIILVTFLLVHLTPGDPARALITERITPAILKQVRAQLGENHSTVHQLIVYVGHVLSGNLGYSYRLGESVNSIVSARLPITLFLVAYSGLLALLIGVPLALLSATHVGRWQDQLTRILLMASLAVPTFWIGVLFVKYLALDAGVFPVGGSGSGFFGHVGHLFLPALTLSLTFLSVLVRSLRALLIEVLGTDYIAFARLKGIGRRELYTRHVLRNALPPAITILGLNMSYLLGASVIVESVFAVNGIGNTLVFAVTSRDFQLVQGLALVFALLVLAITLAVDLIQATLDPRRTGSVAAAAAV